MHFKTPHSDLKYKRGRWSHQTYTISFIKLVSKNVLVPVWFPVYRKTVVDLIFWACLNILFTVVFLTRQKAQHSLYQIAVASIILFPYFQSSQFTTLRSFSSSLQIISTRLVYIRCSFWAWSPKQLFPQRAQQNSNLEKVWRHIV